MKGKEAVSAAGLTLSAQPTPGTGAAKCWGWAAWAVQVGSFSPRAVSALS